MQQPEKPKRDWKRSKLLWVVVGVVVLIVIISAAASGGDGDTAAVVTTGSTAAAASTTDATDDVSTSTTEAATTTTTARPTTTTTTEPPTTTTTESEMAFKESCQKIEFRVLDKNPNTHAGERLRFTGEIVQIMENDGVTVMRVDVTKTSYGYKDTIWVEYPGTVDVYEEDVVWIWGVCFGKHSYETVMGGTITLPGILAMYVENAQ